MFSSFVDPRKTTMPTAETALPGRSQAMAISGPHAVFGTPITGPWPDANQIQFGMGCFWGAERKFWHLDGVISTAVGYAAGFTPNPTYEELCSGGTGHNEVVRVVFDPAALSLEVLMATFWENHNPTQGMRQGNDVGTQYRSGIYVYSPQQRTMAESSMAAFQARLTAAGFGPITTEICAASTFYFAETQHQQYLHKNPGGYCGLGGCFGGD
jgi:peptide-methionine (S)-S-oxide reductase